MKVAVNRCYGGFSLSKTAVFRARKISGLPEWGEITDDDLKDSFLRGYRIYGVERNDPVLIQVIEELGKDASGQYANVQIVEIPDDVKWEISDYDGMEHVAEIHRTW